MHSHIAGVYLSRILDNMRCIRRIVLYAIVSSYNTHVGILIRRYVSPRASPYIISKSSLRMILFWILTTCILALPSWKQIDPYLARNFSARFGHPVSLSAIPYIFNLLSTLCSCHQCRFVRRSMDSPSLALYFASWASENPIIYLPKSRYCASSSFGLPAKFISIRLLQSIASIFRTSRKVLFQNCPSLSTSLPFFRHTSFLFVRALSIPCSWDFSWWNSGLLIAPSKDPPVISLGFDPVDVMSSFIILPTG